MAKIRLTDVNNDNGMKNGNVRLMVDFIQDAIEAVERGDYADAACCVRCAYKSEQKVFFAEEGVIE